MKCKKDLDYGTNRGLNLENGLNTVQMGLFTHQRKWWNVMQSGEEWWRVHHNDAKWWGFSHSVAFYHIPIAVFGNSVNSYYSHRICMVSCVHVNAILCCILTYCHNEPPWTSAVLCHFLSVICHRVITWYINRLRRYCLDISQCTWPYLSLRFST